MTTAEKGSRAEQVRGGERKAAVVHELHWPLRERSRDHVRSPVQTSSHSSSPLSLRSIRSPFSPSPLTLRCNGSTGAEESRTADTERRRERQRGGRVHTSNECRRMHSLTAHRHHLACRHRSPLHSAPVGVCGSALLLRPWLHLRSALASGGEEINADYKCAHAHLRLHCYCHPSLPPLSLVWRDDG